MKKAVVLLSGGMDSAVTLFIAKKKGYKASCLTFDYGQRHKKEILFAKKIARAAKSGCTVLKICLPWGESALLDKNIKVPENRKLSGRDNIPPTYVPARNTIFLSFALISSAKNMHRIVINAAVTTCMYSCVEYLFKNGM